jgi:hypothetical protein
MNTCYNIRRWNTTENPFFESFENSFILTMSTSKRLERNESKDLINLCKNTFVQVNKGWKSCSKPPHITTAAYDLIDAYRNLFIHCKYIHAPILVMEDDAIVMNHHINHYERIDSFVRYADFDVYSLGSFGFVNPLHFGSHKRFLKIIGFSQAVIWSEKARSKALMFMETNDPMHIDVHIMSKMGEKYTYHIPLVVQVFPETENQSNWCYFCNNNILEKAFVRMWIFLLKKLQLHKKPDNWKVLYHANNIFRYFIILSIIFFIMNNPLASLKLCKLPTKKLKHQ